MVSSPDSPGKPRGPAEAGEPAQDRLAQLEAQLEAYKKTLTGIYELYDEKIEELSFIRRISDSLRTPLDLEALCREVVDAVAQEIAVDRLALMLVDQDRKNLRVKASFDASLDETRFHAGHEAKVLPLDQGAAGRAVQTGRPVLLDPGRDDEDPLGQASAAPLSLLFLPLVARDKTAGVFSLSRPPDQPFTEADLRLLTIISDQAATALANVQLFNELAAANIRLQESERQARQTSLYLENLFEAANDVIFTLDGRGRITYVNKKAEEWGYDKKALTGRPFSELAAKKSQAIGLTELLMTQGRQILELGLKTASGERRETLLSVSHIEGEGGPGPGCLVLVRDITERTQLERQLFHSEKLAGLGIMAAGVAHEIGNPLSAVSGYTQILQSGGVSGDEAQEYLAGIESQAARIQRIIEDLLNYSRPATGQRTEIDPAEAVPAIMSMLSAQRYFKNLEIKYDLPKDLPRVRLDRDHLAQIIINIALNAAQAMPEGGRLTISARDQGDRVQIILTDTGPGIPADIRQKIFDPFFTTKSVGRGTGLGLAICHRIVDSYNGSLDVESRPGQGAAFIITLPAAGRERT